MCDEGRDLMLAYEAEVDRYLDAFRALRNRAGTCPKAEYRRLMLAADEARSKSDAARHVARPETRPRNKGRWPR